MEIGTAEENLQNISPTSLPEIKIVERIYDREQARTHLKILIGEPFNTVIYKSGGLGRICFQLVEQFGLSVSPKDLAEILAPQLANAAFAEVSDEESLYYTFHSWLLERGKEYYTRGLIWDTTKDGKRYVRVTAEPMKAFFVSQGIVDRRSREEVLRYWRQKRWLNSGGERRLNKNIKVTLPDGSSGWVQVYEILVATDLPTDEIEDASP